MAGTCSTLLINSAWILFECFPLVPKLAKVSKFFNIEGSSAAALMSLTAISAICCTLCGEKKPHANKLRSSKAKAEVTSLFSSIPSLDLFNLCRRPPRVVSSAARIPCSNGWVFLKKNLQTGGKFKPKSSQFFQSVSRKHKLIYVSFFIKIGQWSTKNKTFWNSWWLQHWILAWAGSLPTIFLLQKPAASIALIQNEAVIWVSI